jgi:hypothetical protein
VQDAFKGADTLRFPDAIAAKEQALVVPRAGLEKIHVLTVQFSAQRAGLGVERFDPVHGSVLEFGQDHFPRAQLVGQHARRLSTLMLQSGSHLCRETGNVHCIRIRRSPIAEAARTPAPHVR